jgi:hypothetical protein
MNLTDVKIFEMATKNALPFEMIEVKKLTYTKPKFVETPRVLTYKPTGEKKVVGGFKNMSLDWKDDDVFDKLIYNELKNK